MNTISQKNDSSFISGVDKGLLAFGAFMLFLGVMISIDQQIKEEREWSQYKSEHNCSSDNQKMYITMTHGVMKTLNGWTCDNGVTILR